MLVIYVVLETRSTTGFSFVWKRKIIKAGNKLFKIYSMIY